MKRILDTIYICNTNKIRTKRKNAKDTIFVRALKSIKKKEYI